jgi:hypothetical protein
MDQLLTFVVGVGVIIVAIAAVLTSASILTRSRMLRTGQVPAAQAQAVRADLVREVGEWSTEQGMRISLRPYWKGRGYTAAQRYVILAPLLERKLLHPTVSDDQFEALIEVFAQRVLSRPVGRVILNSRDWQRLASGTSTGIMIKEISGGIVQVGDHNVATLQQEFVPEYVERLIEALRTDAQTIGGVDGERADSLADSLELDLRKQRWTSVRQTLASLAGIAASGGTIWAATIQILNS